MRSESRPSSLMTSQTHNKQHTLLLNVLDVSTKVR